MRTIYFEWIDDPKPGERYLNSNSLSGGERNRIFFRREGNYKDYSLVSGADFREDGRGFVLLDFDRDGWIDLGVTSPNHPRFRLVRNTIGDRAAKANFVEIELVGGQTSAVASEEWSPRDAYGATVAVWQNGEQKRMFHLSCGEGLSGVNSKRIHVGMGDVEEIDKLEVTWPSGNKTIREKIGAGQRIRIFENPEIDNQD